MIPSLAMLTQIQVQNHTAQELNELMMHASPRYFLSILELANGVFRKRWEDQL